MADDSKTLVFSIEFDTDEGLKRAADFRSAIDADKEALIQLNKAIKANGEINQDQLVQREKLEKSIRENTRARAEQLKAVDDYVKATKGAIDADGKYNGSIKNLRGSLGYLTAQWNDLTKSERENAQVGGVLQKEIKRLSDELKDLEGSVGDNRRSVGGYLDAIRQAPGAMGKFRAGVDGISTAMKANPLGLIMQFLPQITALFNSSGEGADAFAKAMGIVNAIVQEGLKRLVALGGAAFKLFTGDFKGAYEQGSAALTNFAGAIDKAVNAGGALAESLDELEEKERAFGLASARTEKQINSLLTLSKNRTTSEAERIKLLERAEKLELGRNKQEIALAQERINLIKEENKIKAEDADVQDERLKQAETKKVQLEMQTQSILEKIQNRKDQLADAAAERDRLRREKAAAAEAKRAEEAALREADRLADIENKRQIALAETARFLDELAALDKAAAEDKLAREAFLLSVEISAARAKSAAEEKAAAEAIAQAEAEYQAREQLMNATQNLFATLAEENATFAAFDKALTLFRIGLASTEALIKGVAAAQNLPFPGNLIAAGTTIATLTSSFIQAKKLMSNEVPKAPARMGGGGLLDGPSHAEGGIKGTGRFANVEVEGGEAVMSKRATAMFAPILSAFNVAGGGKPLTRTNYAAMGGIIGPSNFTGAMAGTGQPPAIDYNKLAKAVSNQPIYVIPTEIRDKANAADARKVRAGLGH